MSLCKTTVYYHQEPWGEVSIQEGEDMLSLGSVFELEAYCAEKYGTDFELFLVTEDNWRELYDAGVFG